MDKYDLSSEGGTGCLTVLEFQGKKNLTSKKSYNNVYVKGFPQDESFSEDDLTKLFADFGEINNSCIMRDAEGVSKGFGFVCFNDPTSAEKAIAHVT